MRKGHPGPIRVVHSPLKDTSAGDVTSEGPVPVWEGQHAQVRSPPCPSGSQGPDRPPGGANAAAEGELEGGGGGGGCGEEGTVTRGLLGRELSRSNKDAHPSPQGLQASFPVCLCPR